MAKQNLNTCTARELCNHPGIDKTLADSIIQYRSNQNGIKQMEELLLLPDMSKNRYEIVCRKFSLANQPIVLGFANRHSCMGLGVSQFLCQGQSVKSKSDEHHDLVLAPRPITSKVWGQDKSQGQRQVGLPLFKETKCLACKEQQYKLKAGISQESYSHDSQSGQPRKHKRMSSLCLSQRSPTDCKKGGSYPVSKENNTAWTGETKPMPHHHKEKSNPEPSVTMRATTSGNNINFSCTIDKRLLTNSGQKQVKKWTLGHENYNIAINDVTAENFPDEGNFSDDAGSSTTVDDPRLRRTENSASTAITSTKTTSSSATEICTMSAENMLLYDHRNRMTVRERSRYVNGWLNEVHQTFFEHKQKKLAQSLLKKKTQQFVVIPTGQAKEGGSGNGRFISRPRQPMVVGPAPIGSKQNWIPSSSSPSPGYRCSIRNATRITKSATTPTQETDGETGYTEPLSALQRKRTAMAPANKPQKNPSLLVAGNIDPTKKIKHLINNYMIPRTKKKMAVAQKVSKQ